MTSPPFLELRILAAVENVEAVASNTTDAIEFEITRVFGTTDAVAAPFSVGADCDIRIGDGIIWDTVESILNRICKGLADLVGRFQLVVADLFSSIGDVLSSIVSQLIIGIDGFVRSITAEIEAAVGAVLARIGDVIGTIVDTLSSVVGALVDGMNTVINKIGDAVTAIFAAIGSVVDTILSKIASAFNTLLGAASTVVSRIGSGIASVIAALLRTTELVFERVGTALTDLINTLTGAAEGGLAKVRDVVASIPETLREVFSDAREFMGDAIGEPLADMGNVLITQIEQFFDDLIERLDVSPGRILREFLEGVGLASAEVERIASAADKAMPRTPAFFLLGMIAIVPLVIGPLVSAILAPAIEEISQEVAQRVTPTLIPPPDAIDALLREEIDETKFRKEMGEAGYSVERMDILLRSSRRLLDLGQVFRWWLRGFISEDQLDTMLRHRRVSGDDGALLKLAVFAIPPVGDLIRMAVREVFSPEIRERFGQDEGFPAEFAEFGKQQGISEFWAKAYWAAHWTLPSPQQGFEMLQRKVIEPDDLDLLLRALDVMPFWRDRLTQIAFNPLTRVDVRRMHKLGLLDEDEMQLRYEDIGFNAENAAMMVRFTVAFNADEPPEEPGELEGLTRATVLGLYDDGVITRVQANSVMLTLGFSEDAAELFLLQRDLEIERASRTAEIRLVLDQVRSGAIDFDAGQDRLASLGLQPAEMSKATVALLREQERLTSVPPRGDLDKMLRAKLIDDDQYRDALRTRGFTRVWADRYLAMTRGA